MSHKHLSLPVGYQLGLIGFDLLFLQYFSCATFTNDGTVALLFVVWYLWLEKLRAADES